MNKCKGYSLMWFMALLLVAFVAGCGDGDTGAAGAPGTPGTPGTPAPGTNPSAVNLGSAATYALTTSAGLTTSGVTTFGGDVAMDATVSTCTATDLPNGNAVVILPGYDACGMDITVLDTINAAIANSNGLTITGTTIRYNPIVVNTLPFNATVRAVKNDVNTAWLDAYLRVGGALLPGPGTLGGRTLPPGVYTSLSTMTLGAGETLTLDATGSADPATAVWIFQVGSSLTVVGSTAVPAAPTQVVLAGGALAQNVFWQVGTPRFGVAGAPSGGDVTIGGGTGVGNQTIFNGTILAGNSVTFGGVNGTAVVGRVLAGADLLDVPPSPDNTQTGGAVSTTSVGAGNSVTVTLP